MPETDASLPCPAPLVVAYHAVTGVPEEFHEHLHKDSDEYKRLRDSADASTSAAPANAVAGDVAALSLEVRPGCVTTGPKAAARCQHCDAQA